MTISTASSRVAEWFFESDRDIEKETEEMRVDVNVVGPSGRRWKVPAFLVNERVWTVRFSAGSPGTYRYESECTDTTNLGLHGCTGSIEIVKYSGLNPLYERGPLEVSPSKRFLRHSDGTPFFWLADTWWMGTAGRLHWPEDFETLVNDRVEKGFTTVFMVVGYFPDLETDDVRNSNEAGLPWGLAHDAPQPSYFDLVDLRVQRLVERGIVPCIVGSWGYHLETLGVERMKRHWRHLIARYGAYPVVWCLAGETTMPWYGSVEREVESTRLRENWTDVARFLRDSDPFHRLISVHPKAYSRTEFELLDESLSDFEMLQGGQDGFRSLDPTMSLVEEAVANLAGRKPVILAEACYEGVRGTNAPDVQRLLFWKVMLSGAAGHTYGAEGLFQFSTNEEPFGAKPNGMAPGTATWREAMSWIGSAQVGYGKRFLEQFAWWMLVSCNELVEAPTEKLSMFAPVCGAIGSTVRIAYLPGPITPGSFPIRLKGLDQQHLYNGRYFDPVRNQYHSVGKVRAGVEGTWALPLPPIMQDWVFVLEKVEGEDDE